MIAIKNLQCYITRFRYFREYLKPEKENSYFLDIEWSGELKYKLSGLYLSNYIEEDVERKTVSSQFQVNVGVCSSVLIEVTNFNDGPSFNKNEWSNIDDYLQRFHIFYSRNCFSPYQHERHSLVLMNPNSKRPSI